VGAAEARVQKAAAVVPVLPGVQTRTMSQIETRMLRLKFKPELMEATEIIESKFSAQRAVEFQ
jgi:hypothetical protein